MKNQIACSCRSYGISWLPVSFEYIQKLGIKYIELPAEQSIPCALVPEIMFDEHWREGESSWVFSLTDLKDLIKELNLIPISLDIHSQLLHPKAVEIAKNRIEFAHKLGVKIVITGCGEHEEKSLPAVVYNHLKEICEYASDFNITVALENYNWITQNGKECFKVIKAVNRSNLKINYDTGNIYYYNDGVDPAEDIKYIAEYVGYVHLKDSSGIKDEHTLLALGEGRVKFSDIFKILNEAGFFGPLSIEIEFPSLWKPSDKMVPLNHTYLAKMSTNFNRVHMDMHQTKLLKSVNCLKKIGVI